MIITMARIPKVTPTIAIVSTKSSFTGLKETILSMKKQLQLYVQSMIPGIVM